MLQIKILRRLAAAAGLWMCASGALAAPKAAAFLPIGQVALPPQAFVDFCGRQPQDCGQDADSVLAGVRRAEAERRALLALASEQTLTASVGQATHAVVVAPAAATTLEPVADPLSVLVEAVESPSIVAFIDPAKRAREITPAVARLTPDLWARLNRVNADVNRAIAQRTDLEAWGQDDVWSTPLQEGRTIGDCEDYVLEKRRALLDAGVSPRALNIAVVTTGWGETHAVLLVATHKGEFVLDNLSAWVTPWKNASYRWRQRQVNGEAFTWAMAAPPSRGR